MSRNKNIAIISGFFLLGGISYLIYRKWSGDREVKVLSKFIDSLPSQVDISKGADQTIGEISETKIDPNRLHIGNYYGKYSDSPEIRNAIAKVVTDLYSAIKGAGTDDDFFRAFGQIKNKNTMALVDKVYTALPQNKLKEPLFKAMRGEFALYNPQYSIFSDKNSVLNMIPFLNEGNWHPKIAQYLMSLPQYAKK